MSSSTSRSSSAPHAHERKTSMLLSMTMHLADTYAHCRTHQHANSKKRRGSFQNRVVPMASSAVVSPIINDSESPIAIDNRRILTKNHQPVGNSGLDNDDRNLIVRVRDVLGAHASHRGYLVLDLLGQGTFGQVFRCQDLETKELVAVKVIRNHPSYHKQAVVEVQITGFLNRRFSEDEGPHLVRMLDSFSHQNHLCLVFELLSINVYELIAENNYRGFPLDVTRGLLVQLLHGLVQLEDAGVIHCDLKPENIMLAGPDRHFNDTIDRVPVPFIKIVDFGSSCRENETVYSYIQSRFYRSPEVVLGIPYNGAIDLWSLGCIAFEMFLGLPLFPGVSEHDQLRLMEDTLGVLPQHLLRRGRHVLKYYDVCMSTDGRQQQFVLKTPEQYAKEHQTDVQMAKKYFKHDTLDDMIRAYGLEASEDLEGCDTFVHFVRCLLQPDPETRWTAREALQHPFITGQSPITKTEITSTVLPSYAQDDDAFFLPERRQSNDQDNDAWARSSNEPLWGCALFDYGASSSEYRPPYFTQQPPYLIKSNEPASRVEPLMSSQLVFPAESFPWMYGTRCEFGTGTRSYQEHEESKPQALERRRSHHPRQRNHRTNGSTEQRHGSSSSVSSSHTIPLHTSRHHHVHRYKSSQEQNRAQIRPGCSRNADGRKWRSPRRTSEPSRRRRQTMHPPHPQEYEVNCGRQEPTVCCVEQQFSAAMKLNSIPMMPT